MPRPACTAPALSFDFERKPYDPGTLVDPKTADTCSKIPITSHQPSYASFDRFTLTDPPGAPSPDVAHHPFICPNPPLPLEKNAQLDHPPTLSPTSWRGLLAGRR